MAHMRRKPDKFVSLGAEEGRPSLTTASQRRKELNREFSGSYRDETEEEDSENGASIEGHEPRLLRQAAPRRRPKKTVDWKHEICISLGIPYDAPEKEVLDALSKASDTLREIEHLRKQASTKSGPPRFQIVHEIECRESRSDHGVFLDPPTVVNYGPHDAHVRSSSRITNMELFLERNKEVAFMVYRKYECCGKVPPDEKLLYQNDSDDMNVKALLLQEYIEIISPHLRKIMVDLGENIRDIPFPDLSEEGAVMYSPYTWWFHRTGQIETFTSNMPPDFQEHISVFAGYLQDSLGNEWEIVRQLLSRDRITAEFIHYLFIPNEVIISEPSSPDVANLEGFWLRDWAKVKHPGHTQKPFLVELDSSYWVFDGTFASRGATLKMSNLPSQVEEFAITDLTIYPQRYAKSETVQALQERGKMFWKCRERHYVQAIVQSNNSLQETTHSRFMVDTKTYNEMHPREHSPPHSYDEEADYLVTTMMAENDPDLGDNFFMCLPTEIAGFNMQKKEWVKLKVATIQDVEWNEKAFDLLALDKGTKSLVEAVVTNRILAGEQTDVIQGKGNGLFLLLHGGPGTGKTLTAESVAEIAKRPLYRVTCGDIGTKAEEVEEYLEIVLRLGKVWECVVLLDEADVFLEQRQLQQLERNALVSGIVTLLSNAEKYRLIVPVFLRVLEYYDGILILTSNRVGTFDEAFKSRIQLSLWYDNLSISQRRTIWENFMKRLEFLTRPNTAGPVARVDAPPMGRSVDVGIDTPGICRHLDELARHELNGREIRNAISTARQLAMFEGVSMSYEHLDRVIIEANKFQNYIKDLNQGFTADHLAKERGDRYHASEQKIE